MKHKTRKLFSILLTLVMVLGLAPAMSVPAQAAVNDGGKAIRLGTGGIVGPEQNMTHEGKHYTPNSYVYYGYWSAPDALTDSGPIKWRVLDAKKANDRTTKGSFLLSEYLLGKGDSGEVYFEKYLHQHNDDKWYKGGDDVTDHGECVEANVYQGSDAQEWCSTFASNRSNFSDLEQTAMLGVAKTEGDSSYESYGISWYASSLTTADKVFFLSARELADYVGNYYRADGLPTFYMRVSSRTGPWLLRSPHSNSTSAAGMVGMGGPVAALSVKRSCAARPAFNLNLDSVLFTSAAAGGKNGTVGELSAIDKNTTKEWKLTLKDENHKFDVKEKKKKVASGGTVTLNYTGATVKTDEAPNEYISAILTDKNDNLLYYGRLTQPKKAEDDVEVKIPELENGEYILKLFSEQYNGDYKTDYASDFDEVTLSVVPTPVEYDLWLGNTRVTDENASNIFGDNTASYDPDSCVLTLSDLQITVPNSENSAFIYCEEDDLTIEGKAALNADGAEYGIRHQGEGALTINGNISASGIYGGIYAPYADINITGGEVKAIATFKASPGNFGGCDALYTEGKLTVSGGVLTADATEGGQNIGIYAQGGVEISGGKVTAQGILHGISVGENANITINNGIESVWAMGNNKAMNVGNGKISIGNRLSFKMPDDSRYHSVAGVKLNNDKNQVLDGNGQVAQVVNLLPITSGGGGGGGGGAATEQYTLTYNTGGGSSIAATKHEKNATVNLTATPTREGYDFAGWYAEAALTNKITSIKMDGNKTVYAGWTEEIPLLVVTIDKTTYLLKGKTMTMDSTPFIDGNNRTMLPVRVIANALGISNENIKWDSATKTAFFTREDGKVVSCTVNSNVIQIGDENVTIDTVPVIRNNRIYLPMRALFNAFDVPDENILWDAAARTVTVTKKH